MGSATRSVGTVRKGVPEKTAFKLRRTWTEGKNIPGRRNNRKEHGALRESKSRPRGQSTG